MEMNGAPVLLRALENSYEVPVTVEIDGTPAQSGWAEK